jgi:hypothetical protein
MGYISFGNTGSDLITFGEGSSEYVRIDGSGKVGIGVIPTTTLDILSDNAQITLTDSTTSAVFNINNNLSGGGSIISVDDTAVGTSPTLQLRVAGTETVRIAPGAVGINTSTPPNVLSVGAIENSTSDQLGTVGIKSDVNDKALMLQEYSGTEQWEIGVDVDGDLNFFNSGSITPSVSFQDDGSISFAGSLTVSGEIFANGGISLPDNQKAAFGDSDDLQIYHDGSNSYVQDLGTGDLWIAGNQVRIANSDGSRTNLYSVDGGAVSIRYSGAEKIATSTTGVTVTGETLTTTLKAQDGSEYTQVLDYGIQINRSGGYIRPTSAFSGTANLEFGNTGYLWNIINFASDNAISFTDGTNNRLQISTGGDTIFYDNAGTEGMRWDSSASSLGVGVSAPGEKLHVSGGNIRLDNDYSVFFRTASATVNAGGIKATTANRVELYSQYNQLDLKTTGAYAIRFFADSSEAARVDYSGNVGISNSAPVHLLSIGAIENSTSDDQGNLGIKTAADGKAIMIQENVGQEQWEIGVDADGDLNFFNSGSATPSVSFQDDGSISFSGEIIASNGIALPDNAKATFGDSDDLQIYHDGSNSYIKDAGTGNLNIIANEFALYEGNGTDLMIGATPNGAVTLSYNAVTKLATSATGVTVTGETLSTTLKAQDGSEYTQILDYGLQANRANWYIRPTTGFDGTANLLVGNSTNRWNIITYASDNAVQFTDGTDKRLEVLAGGDTIFYDNTGVEGMRWDASAQRLGLGTSSPTQKLDISAVAYSINQDGGIRIGDTGGNWNAGIKIKSDGSGNPRFAFEGTGGSEDFCTRYGKVGIGDSSPSRKLTVSRLGSNWAGVDPQGITTAFFHSGTTNDSSGAAITLAGGDTATNAVYFSNESDNDVGAILYSNSDDSMQFRAGNSERMRLTSAGRVGISTTAPVHLLTVGGVEASGSDQLGNLGVKTASDGKAIMIQEYSGTEQWELGVNADGDLGFFNSGATSATLSLPDGGGVDVTGTVTADSATIQGATSSSVSIRAGDTTSSAFLYFGDSDAAFRGGLEFKNTDESLNFYAGGLATPDMTILTAGNVGIGTASPSSLLSVAGKIAIDGSADRTFEINNGFGAVRFTINNVAATGDTVISQAIQDLSFEMSGSEAMRITSSGRLGLGTSSPSALLDVSGGDASINGLIVGKGSGGVASNTAVGAYALDANTTGNTNTAIGYGSLTDNTTGISNTAVGYISLYNNTTGSYNTATGRDSLLYNIDGSYNSAFGGDALQSNSDGNYNNAFGFRSLYLNVSGNFNNAFGMYALQNNTASYNNAFGYGALRYNTTGVYNSAFGYYSLLNNTTGIQNVGYGMYSGSSNETGSYNTNIGYYAGQLSTGSYNVFIGQGSGSACTTGSNNTIIGRNTGSAGLSDTIILSAGTTERARCDSSGNWGLGTSSPSTELEVSGVIRASNGSNYSEFKEWGVDINRATGYVRPTSAFNGTANLQIGDAGNLWNIVSIESDNSVQITDGTDKRFEVTAGADAIFYDDVGVEGARWDASAGRLGLGTSSPNQLLTLGSSTGPDTIGLDFETTGTVRGSILYNAGAGQMAFTSGYAGYGGFITFNANGSERMRLDTSGRLGLGTSSPASTLDVTGSTGGAVQAVISDGANQGNLQLSKSPNYYGLKAGNDYGGLLFFSNSATERMRLDSSGRLGLGTSSPIGQITATQGYTAIGLSNPSTTSVDSVQLGHDGTEGVLRTWNSTGLRFETYNPIRFLVTGSERLRIDNSGRVGLGTSSPSEKLHLSIDNAPQAILLERTGGAPSKAYITNGGNLLQFSYNASGITFNTGSTPTECMRITSSGRVGISTTSPTEALEVSGTVKATAFSGSGASLTSVNADTLDSLNSTQFLRSDTSDTMSGNLTVNNTLTAGESFFGATSYKVRINSSSTTGILEFNSTNGVVRSNGSVLAFDIGGTNIVEVRSPAFQPTTDNVTDLGSSSRRFDNIYATNSTIQTSDASEKQDIEELTDAELRVAVKCKGLLRKFRWKNMVEEKGDEARIHFGIIAQDLKAAFESEGLDAGRYGMFVQGEDGKMGVRYSELLAFIIAAI